MAEQNFSIERDLREAKAMADALTPYVYNDEIYVSIGGGLFGGGNMPSLTLGALLMRIRRLTALRDTMTAEQQTTLDAVIARNDAVHNEWRMHYDQKLVREAHSRLDAMRRFFEECRDSPRQCSAIYLPEVLRRTIVEECRAPIADNKSGTDDNDLDKKIRDVDGRLRALVSPVDFIWDAQLQTVYPQADYWWLYARPPVLDDK